jgi:hypothetical protein
LGWFESLAGKDSNSIDSKGLRNVVVHHGGTYQLRWTKPEGETHFDLTASLLTQSGFREDDLISELCNINHRWYAFLDAVWNHFVERFVSLPAPTGFDPETHSRYLHLSGIALDNCWMYPRAAQPGARLCENPPLQVLLEFISI